MNGSNVKENIKSGTYKISDKRGRSKIWECFGIIKDENDEEILNFVACKTCINVYKYNKSALSNLSKHKCYLLMKSENKELVEPNQEAKKACTEVLTNWVVQDIRPYSIVNDALIPHPTTIYRNVENSYIIQFNKLHSEILSIWEIAYSLTCDLWTENFSKISYLALTCHFIMDGESKNKLLGVKSMKGSPNTDLNYAKLEQFPLIVLRLVKLFDQASIDMVKTLCMRVLAAWNKIYHTELETAGSRLPYVPPEDKRCLLLICHIYLMAVYEADDVKGYVIDNMINNIRFYYQSFQLNVSSYAMDNLSYTPARFIALTSIHLRLQKRQLFDFYIWNSSESSPVNLFGVVSQAYKSYLLGNLLMELNNMSEDYFASSSALYKRLMNSYVNEREKSEIFMIAEMQKLETQRYAHNIHNCLNVSDFKSKICKGNRMSNIGNYENTDDMMIDIKDDEKVNKVEEAGDEEGEEREELSVTEKDNELSVDPIFQNIPNNEEILYYVYDVLSKKSYRGWQFAKIVLLFKIISHELNMLETWRYHPGLTINFMLNLETKLSQHYIDLAKIFKDYPFMEQEFWLTAFYLNPSQQSYEAVKRLGIRSKRKRNEEPTRWTMGRDSIEAKYGLLSSTIDVKEIVVLTNADDQNADYIPLTEALHSLHLPDSVIKDILTVIFLPRNKGFSWAVEWNDLRRRCKMLMSNTSEKKRCVELTMAEANDRLKFLNIDYAKYKNRPQLDYGSIEQGYENLTGDLDNNSAESEDEEEDFEDDEDVYESQTGNTRGAKIPEEVEVVEDDNSQEDDPYLVGRRRTRARTAAAMASLLCTTEITTRRKRRLLEEEMSKEFEEKVADNEEKSNDSKSTEPVVSLIASVVDNITTPDNPEIQKRNIKECLKERPFFSNSTEGFRPLIDMWNIDKSELQTIDGNCVSLLESSSILNRFAKLKSINKQNNPMSTNEEEQIDAVEMVIKHEKFDPKQEQIPENSKRVSQNLPSPLQRLVGMDEAKEPAEKVNSGLELETKLQEGDIRIKSEAETEKKTEDNYGNFDLQNSQSSEVECKMETDQETTKITADTELIDFEDAIKTNDISLNTVKTTTGNNMINESSSPVIMSEPQESLQEMSSLEESANADHISVVTSDNITNTAVPDTTNNETTSFDISTIGLNENKSVEEEKRITKNSDLTSLSPSASTASKLAVEDPIVTGDSFKVEYLLEVDEKTTADQENVICPDNSDIISVLEKCDVIPLLNMGEGGKVCEQETYTEGNMPGSSLPDSDVIKAVMEVTENADMDYGKLNPVVDDTAAGKIDINTNLKDLDENTANNEVCLANNSKFGISSTNKPLQDLDESKLVVEDKIVFATDESSVVKLDSNECENRKLVQVDMILQHLDSNTSTIEEAPGSNYNDTAISQCFEEIKSVTNETPSSESGAMETLSYNDELVSDVGDGETTQDEVPSSNTSEPDTHLLSSEEIKSVPDEISTTKSEHDISLTDAKKNNCNNVEESLADESTVDKAVELTQEIAITTNISLAQLDEADIDMDAACSSKLAADTPLESKIYEFDDTSVSNRSVGVPPLESEKSKFDETSVRNMSADTLPLESKKAKFDETSVSNSSVGMPSLESEKNMSVETSISNISVDIPLSESGKKKLDEIFLSNRSVDMPPLESEKNKFAEISVRNKSVGMPPLESEKKELDETSVSKRSVDMLPFKSEKNEFNEVSIINRSRSVTPLESDTFNFDESCVSNISVDMLPVESEKSEFDETSVSNRSVDMPSLENKFAEASGSNIPVDVTVLESETNKFDEISASSRSVNITPLELEKNTFDQNLSSNRSVDMPSLESEKNKIEETSVSNTSVDVPPLESETNTFEEISVGNRSVDVPPLEPDTNTFDEISVSNRSVDVPPLESEINAFGETSVSNRSVEMPPLELETNKFDKASAGNKPVDMTFLEWETNKFDEASVSNTPVDISFLKSGTKKYDETSVSNRSVDIPTLDLEANKFHETSVSNRLVDMPPLEFEINKFDEASASNKPVDMTCLESETNKFDEASASNRPVDMTMLESETNKFDEISVINRPVDMTLLESERNKIDETSIIKRSVDMPPLESETNKFDEASASNRPVDMTCLESETNKFDETSVSKKSVDMPTLESETNTFNDTSVSNRSVDMPPLESETNKFDEASASNRPVDMTCLESETNKFDETSVSKKSVDMPTLESETNTFNDTSVSNRSVNMPPLESETDNFDGASVSNKPVDMTFVELETNKFDEAYASNRSINTPPLGSEENKIDETPFGSRSVDMPSLGSEENKSVNSKTHEQKTENKKPTMELEDDKFVVDDTIVDLLSQGNDECQSEVDKIFHNKKSTDMPSLYSDESKSATDYNLSQQNADDIPTLDSDESKDESLAQELFRNNSTDSIDDENNKIKELCITRPLRVLLRKLTPSDLVILRQPRVRVKRIRDVATFLEENVPKKTRLIKRVYVDVEESSDSLMSNSSTSSMYRPPGRPRGRPPKSLAKRTMLRQTPTPDSDCDSNNSFLNVRKRRTSTPNAYSNHSNNSAKSSSRASTATSGNLVVTPRSASGLKLRISHAEQKPILTRKTYEPAIVVDEIIQVSSSSNDESNTMDSIVEVPEDETDPLYEEAVMDLHRSR